MSTGAGFKLHDAGKFCKQGVITAHANVDTRMNLRSPLADQDVSGQYRFSGIAFDTEPFRVTVSTVS